MHITIPKENYEHAVFVADRDGFNISIINEEDINIVIDINLSTEEEKDIFLEDIDCEMQRAKTSHHTPVYSWNTLRNREKYYRLKKFYEETTGKCGRQVLAKDVPVFKANL